MIAKALPVTPEIAEGRPANLIIFNPEKEWNVNPVAFFSKGKNTPLSGMTLKGKVVLTLREGKVVYRDDDKSEMEYPRVVTGSHALERKKK